MSAGRIVLLVFGIIFLIISMAMIVAGGGIMWFSQAVKDDDGFITTRTANLQSNSYAIVTESFHIGWSGKGGFWNPEDIVKFRVEANTNNSKGLFIGIARESDVSAYLDNVRYDEIQSWVSHNSGDVEISYQRHPGFLTPAAPDTQDFWKASIQNGSKQTLDWTPETGDWVLVIMNEDGSSGIDVNGTVGAEVPWMFWAGVGLLGAGVLLLITGILMVVFAARNPRPPIPNGSTYY